MTQTNDNRSGGRNGAGRRSTKIRKRAIEAYDEARSGVSDARQRGVEAIDDAPLIALAGGIAAGALIAALLPRSETEARLLRPVTDRVGDTARSAARAAKEAGRERLEELGLTPDRGADTIRSIFQGAGEAVRSSTKKKGD
jgi:hypothetical protein